VLAAFAMRPLAGLMSGMRARFALVERTMGVLLVLTGFGFLAGWITDASFWLLETFPALARLG
jgi:cytochrome c-type biogenesis protein